MTHAEEIKREPWYGLPAEEVKAIFELSACSGTSPQGIVRGFLHELATKKDGMARRWLVDTEARADKLTFTMWLAQRGQLLEVMEKIEDVDKLNPRTWRNMFDIEMLFKGYREGTEDSRPKQEHDDAISSLLNTCMMYENMGEALYGSDHNR